MKIVVIGGTGLIGSKVVASLAAQGHDAIAAAPSTGVNTLTGAGLDDALVGAAVVVDLANAPSFEDDPAMEFFETAGRIIARAEKNAGVGHHIALSVVGNERLQDSGYFRAKLAQERLIKASGIPFTILHATQFFEFLRAIADFSQTDADGTIHLPPRRFQPIAAQDVAAAVAAAALAPPAEATIEIAGPEPYRIDQLIARMLGHDQDARRVIADPDAGYFGIDIDDGSLMPGPAARLGTTSFDRWLANVPPRPKQ